MLKLLHNSRARLLGLLVTLGIVYGDIGTSPLYVMKTILHVNPHIDTTYIIGALSCIIWTLTLQTTFKYVVLALRADNRGEGGILALYALIRKMKVRRLYLIAIIGAATLVADGFITPAITVVSAMEGLQGIDPAIPVVPLSLAIIACLFFVQQFGTATIGRSFGPLMLLWFTMLGVLGLCHIPACWQVLRAFNPWYAAQLLATSSEWFLVLGAVFLCTTGAEALYSDLGHCGKLNIRISWIFVKATLILNYLGQGAWVIAHQGSLPAGVNPFFAIMPQSFLLVGVIMAAIAAVVASQALISGSFTIFSEAMNLNFWPRQYIKHPSDVKGQLYIPFVNKILFVFCVFTILYFQSSSRIEAAYGLSITTTMLMTTLLLGFYLWRRRVHVAFIALFLLFFLSVELCFLVANLSKFVHGGWFTLLAAGVLSFIMFMWYKALALRRQGYKFLDFAPYYSVLSDVKADEAIPHYATNLIYLSRAPHDEQVEEKIVYSILRKQPKRADHYWIFYVDYVDSPSVLEYTFRPLIADTLFRVNLRIGFRIQPYINVYLRQIVEDLVSNRQFDLTSCFPSLRKHHLPGDFHFVVIRRIYQAGSMGPWADFVMNVYSLVRRMGISEVRAYGLDTSNVTVEKVPLLVKFRRTTNRIRRVELPGATETNDEDDRDSNLPTESINVTD